MSQVVRDLCRGKRPGFAEHGEVYLPGFDEPVTLFEVDPKASDSVVSRRLMLIERSAGTAESYRRNGQPSLSLAYPFASQSRPRRSSGLSAQASPDAKDASEPEANGPGLGYVGGFRRIAERLRDGSRRSPPTAGWRAAAVSDLDIDKGETQPLVRRRCYH